MTYSCALFSRGARTLEEAQQAKLELVCTKLDWFPTSASSTSGAGGAASPARSAPPRRTRARRDPVRAASRARARARCRGRARGPDRDPRRGLPGADGRAIRRDRQHRHGRARRCGADRSLRRPAGGAAAARRPPSERWHRQAEGLRRRRRGRLSERFVFPDGVPLPLSRISLALERAGFVTTHVEGLASDYAETTRHWIGRFEERYDDAVRLGRRARTGVAALPRRCPPGGRDGWASVYQVLEHRPTG